MTDLALAADPAVSADPAASGRRDPVVVVGAGCRLPGVAGIAALRRLLAYPSAVAPRPAAASPVPAGQRAELLLNVVLDALLDAATAPDELPGSRTGLYVSTPSGAQPMLNGAAHSHGSDPVPARRIRRRLDLRSPSTGIETGPATSLLAVQHAREALRDKEIDVAIVAGAGPQSGPGGAAVILKRLTTALKDGDRIYAMIVDGAARRSAEPAQAGDCRVPRHGLAGLVTAALSLWDAGARRDHQNAGEHLEVEEGPEGGLDTLVALAAVPRRSSAALPRSAYLLPVSALDPCALPGLADDYAEALDGLDAASGDALGLTDLCFSAGAVAEHPRHRIAVVGSRRRHLADGLRLFALGERPASLIGGDVQAIGRPAVVFVFPDRAPARPGVGTELLAEYLPFARTLRACDRALLAELGWSPLARLHSEGPGPDPLEAQSTLWAVQTALAALWRDWGITPDLVIGQGAGEIAAATVSGALSALDGAAVVCRRAALLAEHAPPSAQCLVHAGEDVVRADLAGLDGVWVSMVHSGRQLTVSGRPAQLDRLVERLRWHGITCARIPDDHARHTPALEGLRPLLLEALGGIRPRAGRIPLFSTVRHGAVGGAELNAGYWVDNLLSQVRLEPAIRAALGARPTLFVEISPHPVLLGAVGDTIDAASATATITPSLRHGSPEVEALLTSLAEAYVLGCDPAWDRVHAGGRHVPVPN